MPWSLKIALVSAAIYVGLILLLNAFVLCVALIKGIAGLMLNRTSSFVLFGMAWIVPYWIAYLTMRGH